MPHQLGILGAAGRMGRRVGYLAEHSSDFAIAQAIEYEKHPSQGVMMADIDPEIETQVPLSAKLTAGCDVLVDFSLPESTVKHLPEAVALGTACVVGTTGLSETQLEEMKAASEKIAIVYAKNFSLGVNLLFRVAAEVAKALGEDFDIEIVEGHHHHKVDAPSGTAIGLAEKVCEALGRNIDETLVHGRSGRPGARTTKEIGMHALRIGSVVGEHTVHFGSEYERVTLGHHAETRDVFAAGSLRAARWVCGKPAGLYSMEDVLFG